MIPERFNSSSATRVACSIIPAQTGQRRMVTLWFLLPRLIAPPQQNDAAGVPLVSAPDAKSAWKAAFFISLSPSIGYTFPSQIGRVLACFGSRDCHEKRHPLELLGCF
ncbi:MAG TPA: hypothetical protein VKS79_01590, partial [Gemmataceae bacterium]|nr:hypothetical protein [Gemmataceae bacterium]